MRKKSIKLLIIDDELQILEIAKAFLVSLNGFDVDVSPSAREAIERIRTNKYDAIISDYQMPGMNGIEFLKSLRSRDDLTPFILFTGKGREEVVIEALNSGADFYLQKGGEPKAQFTELANMIHKVVQRRRMELELVENEEKFKSIFNSANDAIYILGPEGRILEINDIGCTRLGYTRQEMLKKNVMDFDTEQYAKQVPDRLNEVMEKGFALFETELVSRSGLPIPSEVSSRRINYLGRPAILSVIRDVTERKRNENALLDSTEKCLHQYSTLTGIIESSDSPIYSVDRNYIYTSFNRAHAQAMKRGSGFDIELGQSMLDHLQDEANRIEKKSYIDGALRGERIVTEVHLVDKELGSKFFEVAYNPISDVCDNVTGVAVISRDISHRKKAQLDFEATEEKLRIALSASNEGTLLWKENFRFFNTLMDTIPIPIFYKDKERKYKGCNAAFESLIGLPRGRIIGKNVYEISPKELADQYDSADDQIFTAKVSQDYGSQVRDGDGTLHDVIFHKAPFFDTNGEVDGFIGAIIDVTNEKKREVELKRSEEKYRSLFDSLADGIVCVGTEGRILDFNQSYQRMTGYSDDELRSLRYQDITPEKWHLMESKIIQGQVMERGFSDLYEKEYRRKDGTIFPVELHAYAIHDGLGKIPGMWAIVRDITERKKVGEVLRRERDLAQTYLDVAGFIF
ncbi:MAG: PAS domain S-box protein, partial [Methanomassiliicoccales archaeon]|nr:PAS domain S-box protein [Methanomassiliicoccales archaeon]